MQKLINIEQNHINNQLIQTVNARELHSFLDVGKDFTSWIKERIKQYDFIENQDYVIHEVLSSPKSGSAKSRQQMLTEYCISLDMAKELSMVERNEKGKQARRYFIECEKRATENQPLLPQTLPEALRLAADLAEQKQRLETENNGLKNLFKEGMTAIQFCKMLNGVNVNQISHFLNSKNWLYNESKSGNNLRWRATSYARDKYLTEKQGQYSPHGEQPFITYQPVLLKKGAQRLYQMYLQNEIPMKKTWNGLHTHDKSLRIAA